MRTDTLRQQEALLVTAMTRLEVADATYLPLLNCVDWNGPVQSLYAAALDILRGNSATAHQKISDALAATRRAIELTSDVP